MNDEQIVNDDESGYYVDNEFVTNDEKDSELKQWEPVRISQEDAVRQKYPCLTPDGTTAEFWCEYSTEDEEFICLSTFPFPYPDVSDFNGNKIPQHNVSFEIENMGIGYILTCGESFSLTPNECLKWLDDNSLSKDTPFRIRASVKYYKSGGYYGSEEWDLDINVDIL